MGIKHSYQSAAPDDPGSEISSSEWNANHVIDSEIVLPLVSPDPPSPATDNVSIFGKKLAGRMMPAFIGPSGLDSILQPILARNKISWLNPNGNSTIIGTVGLTATATAVAGWRSNAADYYRNNRHRRLIKLVGSAQPLHWPPR